MSGKARSKLPVKPIWKQTPMRLPLDLHERLVKSAERSGRSLNGETVMRLRSSLDREARV